MKGVEQKFLIVENENQVNDLLNNGWYVISVTAQHVGISGSLDYDESNYIRGTFAVVLERLL
jgi:hypothetical protein